MEYKSNLLIKLGFFISSIGFSYSTGGIKAIFNAIKTKMFIWWFRWSYKHIKRFRNKIKQNCNNRIGEILLEAFIFNKQINFKEIYNNLSEEDKKKYEELREETIREVIEKNNITNEEEINKLRATFDLNN